VEPLDPRVYRDLVRRALEEDVGDGDVTTAAIVPADVQARGTFLIKSEGVLAGLEVAFEVFRQLDKGPVGSFAVRVRDGEWCRPGTEVADVVAPARTLLVGERTALNYLQRLSGIATLARRFAEAANGRITILDTRKTTPTLRALEKYAVRVGGGANHRSGLFDAILIKDNHIALAGGVKSAIDRARADRPGCRSKSKRRRCTMDLARPKELGRLARQHVHRRHPYRVALWARGRKNRNQVRDARAAGGAAATERTSNRRALTLAPAIDISFEIQPV
jgi:nicotinate-nucleotide pyrophosphorylase (carboxylating)